MPDVISKFEGDTTEEVTFEMRDEGEVDQTNGPEGGGKRTLLLKKRTVGAKTKTKEEGMFFNWKDASVAEAETRRERWCLRGWWARQCSDPGPPGHGKHFNLSPQSTEKPVDKGVRIRFVFWKAISVVSRMVWRCAKLCIQRHTSQEEVRERSRSGEGCWWM